MLIAAADLSAGYLAFTAMIFFFAEYMNAGRLLGIVRFMSAVATNSQPG